MRKINSKWVLTILLVLFSFLPGCSDNHSVLKDESEDLFVPINESDFEPILDVEVQPYVKKDICVEGCYDPNNPEIDFTWSNSHLPGNSTITRIIDGDEIRAAAKNTLNYDPRAIQPYEDRPSGTSPPPATTDISNPTSPPSTSETLADMEAQAKLAEDERRSAEARRELEARQAAEAELKKIVDNFQKVDREIGKSAAEYLNRLKAKSGVNPSDSAKSAWQSIGNTTKEGKAKRDLQRTAIESSLPKVEVKSDSSAAKFKTPKDSIQGIAVRRADDYLSYAKRSIENPAYNGEGKVAAEQLMFDAGNSLSMADSKYASGNNQLGDSALRVAYALADAAIALAPIAVLASSGPVAVVAFVGLEALNIAKSWYEYRTGKRLWNSEALSPFEKDMALLNVAFGFMPAAVELGSAGFSTIKGALAYTKELFSVGKSSDDIAAISTSVGKVEGLTEVTRRAGIVDRETTNDVVDAAIATKRSPETPPERAIEDLLASAEKGTARPQTPGRSERLSGFEDLKEREIAEYLEDLGRVVKANPNEGMPGAGRQADAIVDGMMVEFKTLDPGADSSTIRNQVSRSVSGEGQARTILIDGRAAGISEAEAKRGIFRALGAYGSKLDYISVIGKDYFVGYGPRPQ
ncbi:MAG TPA: hypothetical protein V6C65_38665 [Allocoleopsis sp.]